MIRLEQFNETHCRMFVDDFGIEQELKDFFTFFAPGYKFHPKVKAKIWDGRISLFDARKKTIYKGLLSLVIKFCKDRGYEFSVDPELDTRTGVSEEDVKTFVDELNLSARGNKLEVREYQYQAIFKSIENKRNLLLSPTSCLDGDEEIELTIEDCDLDKFQKLSVDYQIVD